MKYKIGTRGSKLALKQTMDVIAKLEQLYPEDEFEAVIITTTGDREQKKQLDQIGSKGVFVQEIEEELLNGTIHAAVHSMKDMPAEAEPGLTFTKAWKREDERDVLVLREAKSFEELPEGAVIWNRKQKTRLPASDADVRIFTLCRSGAILTPA